MPCHFSSPPRGFCAPSEEFGDLWIVEAPCGDEKWHGMTNSRFKKQDVAYAFLAAAGEGCTPCAQYLLSRK
eukprot:9368351-Lingulodinium_polyedra.AAC.1